MITEQTPAQWLEDQFAAIWDRWGTISEVFDPDLGEYSRDTLVYQVRGMRDHQGHMIGFKEDSYVSHEGAPIRQTGELYDLANDLEVITL